MNSRQVGSNLHLCLHLCKGVFVIWEERGEYPSFPAPPSWSFQRLHGRITLADLLSRRLPLSHPFRASFIPSRGPRLVAFPLIRFRRAPGYPLAQLRRYLWRGGIRVCRSRNWWRCTRLRIVRGARWRSHGSWSRVVPTWL